MTDINKSSKIKTEKRRAILPVQKALKTCFGALGVNKKIMLGVSGGPDSRALLEVCGLLERKDIIVVSVDHQTRPESKLESDFVCNRAKDLGFEAEVIKLAESSKSDEASLREARYEAIKEASKVYKTNILITAHHADDEAESAMMDLLGYGGGSDGASMGCESHVFGLKIFRPFLGLSKLDLLLALSALGIEDFFIDSLDQNNISRRSQVRNQIIPYLGQFHRAFKRRLIDRSDTLKTYQGLANHYIEQVLRESEQGKDFMRLDLKLAKNKIELKVFLKAAIKYLHKDLKQDLGLDLRQSPNVMEKIAECARNLYEFRVLGIDPQPNSVTLSATFDLKGVNVFVSVNGIYVNRKWSK